MGNLFGSGFDAKSLEPFMKYLMMIFDKIIEIFKSLGGKATDADDAADATTEAKA